MSLMCVIVFLTVTTTGGVNCNVGVQTNCNVKEATISCNRTLPDVVPAGVKEVYGNNLGYDQTAFVIEKRFP